MRKITRKGRWLGIALLTLGLIGTALFFFLPQEKLLLASASPVCDLRALHLTDGIDDYCWINENELLLLHSHAPASSQQIYDWSLSRYNTTTGVETPLPTVTQDVRKIPGNLEEMTISPDGKNLLWLNTDPKAFYAAVISLDGAPPFTCTVDSGRLPIWFSDSRHWATVEYADTICYMSIHSLDHPAERQRIEVAFPPEESCFNPGWQGELIHENTLVSDDYCWNTPSSEATQGRLLQIKVGGPVETPKSCIVRLPPEARVESVMFATQRNCAAWLLSTNYSPPFLAALHRILPFVPAKSQKLSSIWLCRLDGSKAHELGHLFAPAAPPTAHSTISPNYSQATTAIQLTDVPGIERINWLPGGTKMSFVYQKKLYILPVDAR